MSMITITVEIPAPPEGWVYDGLRNGRPGEMILHQNGWEIVEFDMQFRHHVAIKHVPPWRPAILDHLGPGQWLTIDNDNDDGFADLWNRQPPWNGKHWFAPNMKFFTVKLTEPIQLWGEKAIWWTGK